MAMTRHSAAAVKMVTMLTRNAATSSTGALVDVLLIR